MFLAVIASSGNAVLVVNLPHAVNSEYFNDRDKRINIFVDRTNLIVINGTTIKKDTDLSSILTQEYNLYPNHKAVIIADKNCKARDIEQIISDIQRCGFKEVILKTYSPRLL